MLSILGLQEVPCPLAPLAARCTLDKTCKSAFFIEGYHISFILHVALVDYVVTVDMPEMSSNTASEKKLLSESSRNSIWITCPVDANQVTYKIKVKVT